jgi:RimJ/RimL family protein N-acetyltransferase
MDTLSVKLAPLLEEDSVMLFNWVNDREQILYNSPYKPVHPAQHSSWFESIQKRNDLVIFGIRNSESNDLIGTCQLHSINNISRSAELQIRLGGVETRGKGLGTQAVQLLLNFGFKDLNLNRIYLHVFKTNIRAIHVYEKVGFLHEGVLRKAVYLDGQYEDVVVMSLLKEEFLES